jgi:hypothetical protein
MEWTDEAIDSAHDSLCETAGQGCDYRIWVRAALDAAVKSQGGDFGAELANSAIYQLIIDSRIEALEEAAKICDDFSGRSITDPAGKAAAAIRALKDKPANQTDGGERCKL